MRRLSALLENSASSTVASADGNLASRVQYLQVNSKDLFLFFTIIMFTILRAFVWLQDELRNANTTLAEERAQQQQYRKECQHTLAMEKAATGLAGRRCDLTRCCTGRSAARRQRRWLSWHPRLRSPPKRQLGRLQQLKPNGRKRCAPHNDMPSLRP